MGALQALESGRLAVVMRAEHTEDAAGSGIAHVVYLGIRDVVLTDVLPHIRLRPEGHGLGCGPLGIKGVAALLEPVLGAELRFLRHRADDGDAPGFVGVSLHGLFLHFIAALVADLERRVHQVVPLIRNPEGAFLGDTPDAIQAPGLALGAPAPGFVDPFGLFLADYRITVFFQHLPECHVRL